MSKSIFNFKLLYCAVIVIGMIGISPLAMAAKKQNVFFDKNGVPISMEILQFLSSGGSPLSKKISTKESSKKKSTAKNKTRGSTPEKERELLEVLIIGNTARATQLLKSGVKADYKNYKGESPISVAVSKAWASVVVKLIEQGASVKQKMPSGLSLLHHASSRGYVDVAKLLMKNGLSPSKISKRKKWNSLHVAARYGHWQLVRLYVQMGVDPNTRTSDGKTALEIARIIKHPGIIKILSTVTSARPIGWATKYNKRENRLHYQAIAEKKRQRLQEKRNMVRSKMK